MAKSCHALGWLLVAFATASGCALTHERDGDAGPAASTPTPHRECTVPHGIFRCASCEVPTCCLHYCQEDFTWSECGYVANACLDTGDADGGL